MAAAEVRCLVSNLCMIYVSLIYIACVVFIPLAALWNGYKNNVGVILYWFRVG